ncbi:MAG: MFS transporter [Deferribacteraceae bacterium]|jgi:DHA3 family macrolide efflux protein-like MFS transporter|nr:MFS transporter [Deferribacteraceae bacterium]
MLPDNWKQNTAIFIACQSTSLFGSSLVQYAIFWHITLTTQSGVYATLYILFGVLPTFFLSPMGGVWADKYDRKRLIVISDGCIALATLGLAILLLTGYNNIWFMLATAGLRALGAAVQQPAINAMLPDMVPPDQLTRVNGINGTMQSVVNLASPMLSGALLSFMPINLIFFIDVSTATISIAIMMLFFVSPVRKAPVNSGGYFSDLRMGLAYIAHNRYLRTFFIIYAVFMFVVAAPGMLSPLQVARTYGADAWRLMVIEVSFSAGMVVGGLIMSSWGGWKNRLTTMAVSTMAMGVLTFFLGVGIGFWPYMALVVIIGIALPLQSTASTIFLQENVDSAYMGRVFGIMMMISSSFMPMGMLLMGPLADKIAIEWLMLVTGIAIALLSLIFVLDKDLHKRGLNRREKPS